MYLRKCDLQRGTEVIRAWIPEDYAQVGASSKDWEIIRTHEYALPSAVDAQEIIELGPEFVQRTI